MASLSANRLSVLCGAGLSMAPPSRIPGAAKVAEMCAEKYRAETGTPLPDDIAHDLEKMAVHFRRSGQFEALFVHSLVPWALFNRDPNCGHEAVADFLACHAIREAVTTNYDRLVEVAAQRLGEPYFRAVGAVEDFGVTTTHHTYLKVHGCEARSLVSTIWCKEQLDDAALRDRTERFRTWLLSNLVGRDMLIVGFWSDWAYLSEVFASALPALGECTVVLADPAAPAQLEAKAPELWRWAHGPNVHFIHERESGAAVLDDLRLRFASVFLTKLLDQALDTYEALFMQPPQGSATSFSDKTSADLYALRRDLTGTPRNQPVRARDPESRFDMHSAFHRRLVDKGATYGGHIYEFHGELLRLVSGHGQLMSKVKQQFSTEPPLLIPNHRVVCVGAWADAGAANVLRPDEPATILSSGTGPSWSDHTLLCEALKVQQ